MSDQFEPVMPSTPPVTPVTPTPEPTSSAVTYVEPKSTKWPLVIMSLLFLITASAAAYFFFQSRAPSAPAVSDSSSPTPVATADPTAGWQTYTNSTYAYSFKYPAEWGIVDLTSGKTIEVYFQPDRTKPVGELLIEKLVLPPAQLVQYTDSRNIGGLSAKCMSSPDGVKTWCYLDQQELSFLRITDQDDAYNATLDQILSTFEFASQPSLTSNSPLTTVIELTKPIEWSAAIQGSTVYRGQTLSGQLITTTISEDDEAYTENYNKLGMLLFSIEGSPLTDSYQWEPVRDSFADSPGISIGKFVVDGKTVITRADNGTYTVLVTD